MNDIILSSLLNLFALFGAKDGFGKDRTTPLISEYLSRFYGIRNLKHYIRLYSDLSDFYMEVPDVDPDKIIDGICSNLQGKIRPKEGAAFVLRLMEFLDKFEKLTKDDLGKFNRLAESFGIDDELLGDFLSFLRGEECESVLLIPLGDNCGTLKTIYIKPFELLVFSYSGDRSIFMDDIRLLPDIFQIWNKSSLLKSSHFSPIYYSTIMSRYNPEGSRDLIELCGRDINFRFHKGGDNGMHDFSFTLHGGEMVAIMGGSGVGKSTLLSLLNGNLKPQSGTITVNGHPLDDPEAKATIGFVPQDDLLIEDLTVYENLWYTARLCFDTSDQEELDRKVMRTLTQLGLDVAKDLKVGSPINKYISGGQRKRLNIALELIREPSVLFLDEPTSGLSSADSEKVVLLLKELTEKGKLIVVNIHQPSSDVYKLFDRLWLLDKGGYPVYDGNPIEAVSRFKTLAHYADSRTSTCPVCGNVNPEIILNIIDEKIVDSTGEMSDTRKTTPQEWHRLYLDERPEMPAPDVKSVPPTGQKRPGVFKQMVIFLQRLVRTKVTNLQYILLLFLEPPVLAVICGFLTRFTPSGGTYTLLDNKNFPSFIFMAIIVSIFLGMSGSAEEIIRDRALLKREKFLNLSHGSYISSKILYMGAVCLIQTFLFTVVGTLVIGVHGMFFLWWLMLFASAFLSSLIGLLLSQCLNSVVAIYITIPLLLIPQILLCGLVVKFDDINTGSRTGNVPVIGDVIPSRWAYEGLSVGCYTMNDYEKDLYELDRLRFEALYYKRAVCHELESRLEIRRENASKGKAENPHHLELIRNELPRLSAFCGMEPYAGDWSYESLLNYITEADSFLARQVNTARLAQDKEVRNRIKLIGADAETALKQANSNMQLENLMVNRNTEKMYKVCKGSIVPCCGYVFLTPRSTNGRAPFYSGVKVVGHYEIETYWFDLMVLLLMCLVVGACLYTDFPGKFVREERN